MGCILGSSVYYFLSILRFGAFAAYFLHYNRTNFYEENQDWDNFGNKIGVKKAKDCVEWDDETINPNANTLVFEMKQLDPNPQKSDSAIDPDIKTE